MKKILALLLMLSLCMSAQAQVSSAYSPISAVNKIIIGTPGITVVSTAGSTAANAAAYETAIVAGGARIPIAVTAAAAISGAGMAATAGKIIKAGTGIGIAAVILPMIWDASGFRICPPPQFVCKAQTTPVMAQDGWFFYGEGGTFSTPDAACGSKGFVVGVVDQPGHASCVFKVGTPGCLQGGCFAHQTYSNSPGGCGSGTAQTSGGCRSDTANSPTPVTAGDIANAAAAAAAASAANQQKMYDVMRNNSQPVVSGTDPMTVTAAPASSPPVTHNETVSNPDGSTSTKVTTSVTTVTPVVTGSTVNTASITYPASTTVTTQTTNNTTGAVTTSTQTQTETATPDAPSVPSPSQWPQIPTDYNRENTQMEIRDELKATGAPVMPDQAAIIASKNTDEAAKIKSMQDAAVADKVASQAMWWTWIWNAPGGTCAPFTGTVHGYYIAWDFCDWFGNFRDIIGWLLGIGTCWSIYNTAFKVNGEQ